MEIDHEFIVTVTILIPLIQEGLLSVTSDSMCTKWLATPSQACPGKSVAMFTDHLDMTIAVDED